MMYLLVGRLHSLMGNEFADMPKREHLGTDDAMFLCAIEDLVEGEHPQVQKEPHKMKHFIPIRACLEKLPGFGLEDIKEKK